jgi:hypothetical protein
VQTVAFSASLRSNIPRASVECYELASVAKREGKQVGVGDLSRALQALSNRRTESEKGKVVGPELVAPACFRRFLKEIKRRSNSRGWLYICGIGSNPNEATLGDGAGSPAPALVSGEPLRHLAMELVVLQ